MTGVGQSATSSDWAEVQRELNELFRRYGLSVATGLTAKGVMIGSQDERVDAYNLGEVRAYSDWRAND
jgi:hypothetical protein